MRLGVAKGRNYFLYCTIQICLGSRRSRLSSKMFVRTSMSDWITAIALTSLRRLTPSVEVTHGVTFPQRARASAAEHLFKGVQ